MGQKSEVFQAASWIKYNPLEYKISTQDMGNKKVSRYANKVHPMWCDQNLLSQNTEHNNRQDRDEVNSSKIVCSGQNGRMRQSSRMRWQNKISTRN